LARRARENLGCVWHVRVCHGVWKYAKGCVESVVCFVPGEICVVSLMCGCVNYSRGKCVCVRNTVCVCVRGVCVCVCVCVWPCWCLRSTSAWIAG